MKITRVIVRGFLPLFLACTLPLATGCGRSAARLDQQEENDPALRRARVRQQAKDIDGAIELYNRALDRKPQLARAHLEVGLLYDGHKEDYNRAIYHYQRYLELRPGSEKTQLIQDLIRRARISFAVSLSDPPPQGVIEEIATLRRENDALKGRLTETVRRYEEMLKQAQATASRTAAAATAPSAAAPASARTAPGPAALELPRPVAEPLPPARIHRVQRGETLSSIAGKMYNDSSQWRKIYEANRQTLKSPGSLDVGQELIIP